MSGNVRVMPDRILIADDDPSQRNNLAALVESFGFEVNTAANGEEALEKMAAFPPSAIVSDLVMPGMDGFALLRQLTDRGDRTPTVVLTGFGSIEQAISIVHDLKAFWFLEKPVQPGVIRALLERAVQQKRLLEETDRLARELSHHGILGELVGDSPAMREVFFLIRQVAPTTAPVLITGESGSGKELVARAIHNLSTRAGGPFVAVNCAALPESLMESELFGHEKGSFTGAFERRPGCFEQAQNGTLLLDEIGEMPIGTQAKLLRVLEESKVRRLGGTADIPVSVRILAATNRPPEVAIQNKKLREDLYYRLNVFHISLPPLRDRKMDIPPIAAAMIRDLNKKHGTRVTHLGPDMIDRLMSHSWPGNVRELRNLMERAVIMAQEGEVQARHLANVPAGQRKEPVAAPQAQPVDEDTLQMRAGSTMSDLEEKYIRLTLKLTNNNRRKAAALLGFSLRTLHNKLRRYEKEEARAAASHAQV